MVSPAARVLIVVRRDMDVDNLAPIAYEFAANRGVPVIVLSISADCDPEADPRLAYLARKHGIACGNLFSTHRPDWRHGAYDRISTMQQGWLRSRLQRLLTRDNPSTLYDQTWCEGLLRKLAPTHLVMDWAKANTLPCGGLTAAARRMHIPSFALPHGVDTWNSPEYYVEPLKQAGFFGHFDFIVTPNSIRRDFLAAGGFPARRIAVLGSARFSPAWEKVLVEICREEIDSLPQEKALNLVWFDKTGSSRSRNEMSRFLNQISALPGVRLAVKPKPHSDLSYDPDQLSPDVIDGSRFSSFALCKWSDVLIGLPSGIMLEALVQEKELILLRGLEQLGTCEPYEDPPVCWLPDNETETIAAIEAIRSGASERPYREKDVQRFVDGLIFYGLPPERILAEYADFILNASDMEAFSNASVGASAPRFQQTAAQ